MSEQYGRSPATAALDALHELNALPEEVRVRASARFVEERLALSLTKAKLVSILMEWYRQAAVLPYDQVQIEIARRRLVAACREWERSVEKLE
jgi:hypothetical protein